MLITAHYRVHINSIDLSGASRRCCGGIGFAVKRPALRLRITRSRTDEIVTRYGLEAEKYFALVKKVEGFRNNLRLEEIESVNPHVGLGSLTQLKLSMLKAIRLLQGQPLDEKTIPAELDIGTISGI